MKTISLLQLCLSLCIFQTNSFSMLATKRPAYLANLIRLSARTLATKTTTCKPSCSKKCTSSAQEIISIPTKEKSATLEHGILYRSLLRKVLTQAANFKQDDLSAEDMNDVKNFLEKLVGTNLSLAKIIDTDLTNVDINYTELFGGKLILHLSN